MELYLVTEINDREALPPDICKDRLAASRAANERLKNHCADTGYLDEYEDCEAKGGCPAGWPPSMALDKPEDGQDGAWANVDQKHFDAHVIRLDSKACRELLSMLLQKLCQDIEKSPGCQKTGCANCPVKNTLYLVRPGMPWVKKASDQLQEKNT